MKARQIIKQYNEALGTKEALYLSKIDKIAYRTGLLNFADSILKSIKDCESREYKETDKAIDEL